MTRDDKLAQRMFYGGCALLPWLWIVNIMYYRKQVYGPVPLLDYFPGGSRREEALARIAEHGGISHDEDDDSGPIQNMPAVGGSRSRGDETDEETEFDDDGTQDEDEARLVAQMMQKEVEKWVKRSTMSATLVVGLFVTWIVVFQVYKDAFGPNWLVMSEDEGERTGW